MGRHSQPLLQEQAYQHEACGSYLWFPCLRILGSPGCRLWSPSCPCGCRGPYSPCPPCSFSSPHTCSPHSPCPFCSSSTPSSQARPCTNCTPRASSPPRMSSVSSASVTRTSTLPRWNQGTHLEMFAAATSMSMLMALFRPSTTSPTPSTGSELRLPTSQLDPQFLRSLLWFLPLPLQFPKLFLS